jgi:predicted nucleic acid-binding protein
MKLTELKSGEHVLIDTNIIFFAMQKKSGQCIQFLQRCIEENVYGVLPISTLAEIMHALMIAEAKDNGWIEGADPARKLRQQPQRVAALLRYDKLMRDILNLGLLMEPVQKEDFITAMMVQRQSGLLTNDALLSALGMRLRINSIATANPAFEQVQGLMIYRPDDIELE